jgi:DNA polymerase/3'-5' exonuclease PolX
MINHKIIKELEKFIIYLKTDTNPFRLSQSEYALSQIKRYKNKITLKNLDKLFEVEGIGKGTIERVKEILLTGTLKEITNTSNLVDVIGIGRMKAQEFIKMGINTVKMLKEKIKLKEIEVSDSILMGLKYFNKVKNNIPRKEMEEYDKYIDSIISNINSINNTKYEYLMCGSYRRGKDFCNDIDIVITNKDTKYGLNIVIDSIDKILDTISMGRTKFMGFSKLCNDIRRIDIRYVQYKYYHSAILYFTGSMELNRTMRQKAKSLGYKLSEYGLSINNKWVETYTEKDIFKMLNMNYIQPNKR